MAPTAVTPTEPPSGAADTAPDELARLSKRRQIVLNVENPMQALLTAAVLALLVYALTSISARIEDTNARIDMVGFGLNDLGSDLRAEINERDTNLRAEINDLDTKIDDVETNLRAEINDVETKLSAEIDDVETKLSAEIDHVEAKLSAEIDELETKMDARFALQDDKIDGVNLKLTGLIAALGLTEQVEAASAGTADSNSAGNPDPSP